MGTDLIKLIVFTTLSKTLLREADFIFLPVCGGKEFSDKMSVGTSYD